MSDQNQSKNQDNPSENQLEESTLGDTHLFESAETDLDKQAKQSNQSGLDGQAQGSKIPIRKEGSNKSLKTSPRLDVANNNSTDVNVSNTTDSTKINDSTKTNDSTKLNDSSKINESSKIIDSSKIFTSSKITDASKINEPSKINDSTKLNNSYRINESSRYKRNYSKNLTNHSVAELGPQLNRLGWQKRVEYATQEINNIKEIQRYEQLFPEENIYRNVNLMLATSITTIMLLARKKYDIPIEYYMWTELYLKMIKDEYGNYPPNIKNLLAHIAYVKKENNISWQDIEQDIPENLTVHRIPPKAFDGRNSRIPISKNNTSLINSTFYRKLPIVNSQSTPIPPKFSSKLSLDSKLIVRSKLNFDHEESTPAATSSLIAVETVALPPVEPPPVEPPPVEPPPVEPPPVEPPPVEPPPVEPPPVAPPPVPAPRSSSATKATQGEPKEKSSFFGKLRIIDGDEKPAASASTPKATEEKHKATEGKSSFFGKLRIIDGDEKPAASPSATEGTKDASFKDTNETMPNKPTNVINNQIISMCHYQLIKLNGIDPFRKDGAGDGHTNIYHNIINRILFPQKVHPIVIDVKITEALIDPLD